MPNLNSTIDLDVKKFFRWWQRELDFLVPEKVRQLVSEKQGFIIVRPQNNNQLALAYVFNGVVEPLAVLARNASGVAQYQALQAKDERLAKANLILRLTPQEAIHKELTLPAAVKENLLQVVAYEVDRYTPFKAEQVYFAVKPLEGENEPGHIKVMLVLTPKETLDALYEDIKTMGMSPLFVDYEAIPNDLEQRYDNYNLLPEALREKTTNTSRLLYTALVAAVCILLGAVLVLPVLFEYQTVNALQQKIDAIEKDAKGVKALQMEIDAMINETRQLIAEKTAVPAIVDMLNTLSGLMKDDTWLSYLQYSDGHLQIQGESPSASALIGVLEDSEMFANARFGSPVTQDKATKLERFQITVDVTPVPDKTKQSSAGPASYGNTPSLAIAAPVPDRLAAYTPSMAIRRGSD